MKNRSATVPASEFTRNFGHFRVQAHRGPIAVSSHGRIAGYFIAPDEYEDYERMKAQRRSFATADLGDEKVEAVAGARMHRRHAHLNKLLKDS
jgi:PHD/YefM family antitoxin component YafN of YafNO toxin-antitoxin module